MGKSGTPAGVEKLQSGAEHCMGSGGAMVRFLLSCCLVSRVPPQKKL